MPAQAATNAVIAAATDQIRRTSHPPHHPSRGDVRRIARRFLGLEDLILRFATCPDLDTFSSNEAERTIGPVKVQQRGVRRLLANIHRTRGVGTRCNGRSGGT